MKFIGITGGVGAGKSAVLDYLATKPGVRVMLADEIAHELMELGTDCYEQIRQAFPEHDIYKEDGHFDRIKLAKVIFSDGNRRARMNGIVHPAVKAYVIAEAKRERQEGTLALLVLEAALLIEEHYDEICDELWYIYADEEVRKERLIEGRGYSEKKVREIMANQLSEDEFSSYCDFEIDNSGDFEETKKQLDHRMKKYETL